MRSFALLLAALAVGAAPASAQFRQQTPEQGGLGFTADLAFAQLSGGGDGAVGDSVGTGLGAALFGFYELETVPARLGAGASYTRFTTEGPGDAFNKLSLYAQGTWQITDPNTSVIPYLGGTVGYVKLDDDEFFCLERQASTCPPEDLLRGREWSGLELGAVVGVDLPMSETLNLDFAGRFSWLGLGDVTAGGQTLAETSTNLSTFGLRAGVTIFPR